MYVRTLVFLNVPSATPRLSYRKAKNVMPFFLLTFLTSLLTDIPMPMSSVRGKSPRLTPISPSTTLAFRLKISTSLLQMTILTNCTRLWTLQASRKPGSCSASPRLHQGHHREEFDGRVRIWTESRISGISLYRLCPRLPLNLVATCS